MMKCALMGVSLATLAGCVAIDVDETRLAPTVSHFGGMTVGGTELPFSKAVMAGDDPDFRQFGAHIEYIRRRSFQHRQMHRLSR